MSGVRVTAEDLENGDHGEKVVEPGDFCLIVVDPLYLDGTQRYANGTVVLTLKRRRRPS